MGVNLPSLPAGIVARSPEHDDLTTAHAVLAAYEQELHGEADITLEDLRADWNRPSFSLDEDAVLLFDGRQAVGYVEVAMGRIFGGVLPTVQRRGLGGALLDWGIQRARQGGSPSAEVTAPDADRALRRLLEVRGFARRWETWLFQFPLGGETDVPLPPVDLPEAMTLRTVDAERDARSLHELIDTAFSDWEDRDASWSFEDWHASFLTRDDFEPRTSWVIERDGELVGAALSLTDRGWGWLEQLAVRRDLRGQGLGTALLGQTFRSYRDLGLHTAGLSTESRTGARTLYERVGMTIQRSFTRWSLPLR